MHSAAAQLEQSRDATLATEKEMAVLLASQQQAEIASAKASVDQAQINFSYLNIVAQVSNTVGQRSLHQGAWVSAGSRLLVLVPLAQSYIMAN